MSNNRPGIGIDAHGDPVIDPTANVIALVEANAKAAFALRDADIRFNDAVAAHLKEIAALRSENNKEARAFDREQARNIREVDQANAQATASQILQAVNTNASVAATTALTLAKQVTDTAAAQEARQSARDADTAKRLSAVELSMSKGEGKSGGVDQSWKVLVAIISLIATLLVIGSIGVALVVFLNRTQVTQYTPAPAAVPR